MSDQAHQHKLELFILSKDETVEFARTELKKYLQLMASEPIQFQERDISGYNAKQHNGIAIGLHQSFGISTDGLENPSLDDAIYIHVDQGKGMISGSNPRSVLLAVYRFLEESGCRWVRHGADGEFIPHKKISELMVEVNEAASYRHRGLCIEGAVSFENMLENIDWAPKAGFNAYFLEFETPYTFFDRWYSHRNNSHKQAEPVSVEQVAEFTLQMEKEIKKRGLLYHAVGHGLTCEPFGLQSLGWDPVDVEVSEQTSQYFALVDGKRELWGGVPLNTNLCFSNPQARRMMVDYAADYLEKKPYIDYLHFWLADSFNNHCECDECRKMLPADFYIKLLNELDSELSKRSINTKIVFLLYLDLLWAPQFERFKKLDRFVLLFAPISRTYSKTYDTDTRGIELPPYVRNELKFPSNINENYAFLESWRKFYEGDSFAYEYHFMWDHYFDPGYFKMAEILSEDVKNLKKLGLNGMISDQTQRSFFPTGYGMYLMGKTLWNTDLDFRQLAKEYFTSAFGRDGDRCMAYMEKLSELFDPPYMRGEKPQESKEAAKRLGQIKGWVDAFLPVIEENISRVKHACHRQSWEYVRVHAAIVSLLGQALHARAEGEQELAAKLWNELAEMVQKNEDDYQSVLDVYLFIQTLRKEFDFSRKRTSMFGGEVT